PSATGLSVRAQRSSKAEVSITSGSSSATVTVKVPVATLPLLSVAVQVTFVAPAGKTEPEDGSQVTTGASSRSSVAVASNVTGCPATAVMASGRDRTGGVVSSSTGGGPGGGGDGGCVPSPASTMIWKLPVVDSPYLSM